MSLKVLRIRQIISDTKADTVALALVQIWRYGPGFSKNDSVSVFTILLIPENFTGHEVFYNSSEPPDYASPDKWLRTLYSNPDPLTNPPFRLAEFFAAKYGNHTPPKEIRYLSDQATAASDALGNAPCLTQDMVNKLVHFLGLV
ncbi:hypothetical protein ACHAQJ_009249 [Trichoderma viride]